MPSDDGDDPRSGREVTDAFDSDGRRHLSMLRIVYGASAVALDAFQAADNPVDRQILADLERMVERTRQEIARLASQSTGAGAGAGDENDKLSPAGEAEVEQRRQEKSEQESPG